MKQEIKSQNLCLSDDMVTKKSNKPELKIFTDSEFLVKRIYQKSSKKKPTEDSGTYPFTRGIHPGMFRERFWTMRQYSGFGDAKLTNERFKFMLEKGQTGLSMAFDLPTQIGYDSDSPQAEGEVGKVGVSRILSHCPESFTKHSRVNSSCKGIFSCILYGFLVRGFLIDSFY